MEMGIIEGIIAFMFKQYKAHFELKQKNHYLFFHEICTIWKMNDWAHSVKVSNQGAV